MSGSRPIMRMDDCGWEIQRIRMNQSKEKEKTKTHPQGLKAGLVLLHCVSIKKSDEKHI
jgi:hypothetical protein